MTDIVEQLREWSQDAGGPSGIGMQLVDEAADEIERLRALLREYIENDLTDEWEYDFLKRIREAIGNE